MSSKFSKKQNTNANTRKSDIDFYKMSVLFFILCAVLLLILKVSTTLPARHSSGKNMAYELYVLFRNPVYIITDVVLLIASAVWFITNKVRKIDESLKAFSSLNILSLMIYITAFSAFFGYRIINNPSDCMFALSSTIIVVIIYYVSKIYNSDFLIFSIENAVLALFLYKYWHLYTVRGIVGKLLLIAAFIIVGIAFTVWLGKNKSRFASSKKANTKPMFFPYFISLALWSVFMFIKLPDPFAAPVLTIGVMLTVFLIQYIIFTIIYTIKLICE